MLTSRKQLLIEAENELKKIIDGVNNTPVTYEAKNDPWDWVNEIRWPFFTNEFIKLTFKKLNLTKKEILSNYPLYEKSEKNGFKLFTPIKNQPAFRDALELAEKLKDNKYKKKSGKSWYPAYDELMAYLKSKNPYSIADYGMDPKTLVDYVIRHGKMPRPLGPTEGARLGWGQLYYGYKKYPERQKEKFNWKNLLVALGRGFIQSLG